MGLQTLLAGHCVAELSLTLVIALIRPLPAPYKVKGFSWLKERLRQLWRWDAYTRSLGAISDPR